MVGLFGLAMSMLVLARGGGYYVVVPRLALVVPLAVVGVVTALAAMNVGRASMNAVMWLGVVALAGVGWNFLVYALKFDNAVWGLLVPLAHPTGIDFRDGLYDPARAFSTARSGWPPLTLLGSALHLGELLERIRDQVSFSSPSPVDASSLSAGLAVKRLPCRAWGRGRPWARRAVARVRHGSLLVPHMASCTRSSGEHRPLRARLSLLAVWPMITLFPGRCGSPAAVLALAIGLKLYPAILLVILFWRYRRRAVLPAAVTTLAVLLAAGPAESRHSLVALNASGQRPCRMWGQDSATAIAHVLRAKTSWWGAVVDLVSADRRPAGRLGGDHGRSVQTGLERP